MLDLWDDLERWTMQDEAGRLGTFEARIVGGWIHVGLPLAQTILTDQERRALPGLFLGAGMDPTASPTSADFRRALLNHGSGRLRGRTLAAIQSISDEGFADAVLDIVADEFVSWLGDGDLADDATHEVFAGLRICLALTRVSRKIVPTLRCRSGQHLPDAGLRLLGAGPQLRCAPYLPGWSLPLVDETASEPFVLPPGAWQHGLSVEDAALGWRIKLRAADVRIFSSGEADALPGLVERLDLPRRQAFYLAIRDENRSDLELWGRESCAGWRDIEIVEGLPSGWTFVGIDEAFSDSPVRSQYPSLAFPDRLRVRFAGGIRSSAGNSFFEFAVPDVVLDGADGSEHVFCNGELLVETSPFRYQLPDNLSGGTRVSLQVARANDTAKRISLYLVSNFDWRSSLVPGGLTSGGQSTDSDGGTLPPIAGAMVRATVEPEPAQFEVRRAAGFPNVTTRTFLIGRCPGHIAHLSEGALPKWPVIWAVPLARRGTAVYCGPSLEAATPISNMEDADAGAVAEWKHVLWRWRRRIAAPRDPPLASLWQQYIAAARDA
ncbi:MAG: hypothetical protein WEF50_07360 [Myxococcota bacterium]